MATCLKVQGTRNVELFGGFAGLANVLTTLEFITTSVQYSTNNLDTNPRALVVGHNARNNGQFENTNKGTRIILNNKPTLIPDIINWLILLSIFVIIAKKVATGGGYAVLNFD